MNGQRNTLKKIGAALLCAAALPLSLGLSLVGATAATQAYAEEHSNASSFSFALIGDQPYSDFFEPATASLIEQINQDPSVGWILHIGDIKGGNEPCTDKLLSRRISQLQQSEKPVVYVPGDNEWTDCHRPSNGNFNTQERLQFLRQLAFSKNQTLGKKTFEVRQQTSHPFPEHLMWQQGSTLFISLNVPGSNNDLNNPKSRKTPSKKVDELLRSRGAAIDAWFDEAEALFLKVNGKKPTETVIAIQGNSVDGSGGSTNNPLINGYSGFMTRLVKYINTTERPVLLAHGDTHRFKWDRPSLQQFGATPKTNALFYRVEGWGHPFLNSWVSVQVKPGSAAPFEAISKTQNTGADN